MPVEVSDLNVYFLAWAFVTLVVNYTQASQLREIINEMKRLNTGE